jgi:branched-chain amino acid transport system permease protein
VAEFLTSLGPTVLNTLGLMGIYVILALGLNMINGMGGMFSIGHAGFWALGAYAAGVMIVKNPLGLPPSLDFPMAIAAGILAACLAGFILSIPCLRLSGDYLAIVTLGFSIIIVTLLYNIEYVGAATGMSIPTRAGPGVIWAFVLLCLIFYYRVQFSNAGRTILALREDEIAAQSIGINRVGSKTLVFVLGAGMAGLAGALYAGSANYINPLGFEFDQSIKILTMVVMGGLGSMTGVTFAAMGLTLLPEILRLLQFKEYEMLAFAVILLVIVLWRPEGIFGQKEIWDIPGLNRLWKPQNSDPVKKEVTK